MKGKPTTPLTREMAALIERMRRTQSVAVVHLISGWWVAENDLPVTMLPTRAEQFDESRPRLERDRMHYDKPVFLGHTVRALVARRELRFTGRAYKGLTPASATMKRRAEFRY